MHELKIAQDIIKIVSEELAQRKISSPVQTIHFKVGHLHAIIPESLQFNFNAVKADHPVFQNAELLLEIIPLRVQCRKCGRLSELSELLFECPHCHSTDLEIINGQEMYVESIELKEV